MWGYLPGGVSYCRIVQRNCKRYKIRHAAKPEGSATARFVKTLFTNGRFV